MNKNNINKEIEDINQCNSNLINKNNFLYNKKKQ